MNRRCATLAVGVCLLAGAVSAAFDTVRTSKGTVSGRVKSMSPYQVVVDRTGVDTPVPVNEIIMIFYDEEPTAMRTARTHLIGGRYEDALEQLDNIKPEDVAQAPALKQDVDYYRASCAGKLALGGSGTVADAGRQMMAFVRANTGSYHYLEACEMVGDLLVAMGRYSNAEQYYAVVAKAPWPDYKMRAGVAVGRARLAQGNEKIPEARAAFDAVLQNDAPGDLADAQRLAAKLGIARCMAAEGQQEQAIAGINKILASADPEDVELHARAYNTLGAALRRAGRDNEALLAYLHVDLLYFHLPDVHAEALFNLAELWNKLHKTERAVRARRVLETQYKASPWAR